MSCGDGKCTVYSAADLVTAVEDSTVGTIVVAPGHYEFSSDMCSESALCIDRAVMIEAEVPGSVVLDAKGSASTKRRVFDVQSSAAAELIGLNITGGNAQVCSPSAPPRWNVSCACFLHAG